MTAATTSDGVAPILFVHHAGINWIRGSTRCLLDLLTHIDRRRFAPIVLCNQPVILDAVRALDVPAHDSARLGQPASVAARSAVAGRRQRAVARHRNQAYPFRRIHPGQCPGAGGPTGTDPAAVATPSGADARRAAVVAAAPGRPRRRHDERLCDRPRRGRFSVRAGDRDLQRCRPEAAVPGRRDPASRANWAFRPDAVVLTLVGSLIHRKAVDIALRAFAGVCARPHAQLTCCSAAAVPTGRPRNARRLARRARPHDVPWRMRAAPVRCCGMPPTCSSRRRGTSRSD